MTRQVIIRRMGKEYSGTLGFVIVPDAETKRALEQLSQQYSQEGDVLPNPYHLSLYHGHFKNVPEEVARQLLHEISTLLSTEYSLDPIEPYGGRFLFWNVENPYRQLQRAHEVVIEKLFPYVDEEKVGLALREGLRMSEQEKQNLRKYSHPLVKELFMPHYSLFYRQSGIEETGQRKHKAKVLEIQFVEIGEYSKINQVFLSSKNN